MCTYIFLKTKKNYFHLPKINKRNGNWNDDYTCIGVYAGGGGPVMNNNETSLITKHNNT